MSYHLDTIPKGVLGELSKIQEELNECFDAEKQNAKIMLATELSDLYGALEHYAEKQGLTMEDLKTMAHITKRAFDSGRRVSEDINHDNIYRDFCTIYNTSGNSKIIQYKDYYLIKQFGVTNLSYDDVKSIYNLNTNVLKIKSDSEYSQDIVKGGWVKFLDPQSVDIELDNYNNEYIIETKSNNIISYIKSNTISFDKEIIDRIKNAVKNIGVQQEYEILEGYSYTVYENNLSEKSLIKTAQCENNSINITTDWIKNLSEYPIFIEQETNDNSENGYYCLNPNEKLELPNKAVFYIDETNVHSIRIAFNGKFKNVNVRTKYYTKNDEISFKSIKSEFSNNIGNVWEDNE